MGLETNQSVGFDTGQSVHSYAPQLHYLKQEQSMKEMANSNVTPDGFQFKEHDVLAGNKMSAETASSAPGGEIFKREPVRFEMKINGTVNGQHFIIHGIGGGDARIGKLKGK